MKTIDPDENEIYKFLGLEQADGIKAEAVFERIKSEISKRVKLLTKTERCKPHPSNKQKSNTSCCICYERV